METKWTVDSGQQESLQRNIDYHPIVALLNVQYSNVIREANLADSMGYLNLIIQFNWIIKRLSFELKIISSQILQIYHSCLPELFPEKLIIFTWYLILILIKMQDSLVNFSKRYNFLQHLLCTAEIAANILHHKKREGQRLFISCCSL